ncbi:MAG: sugar ABC transporter substrate-binding protein [Spirochaetales bacterium]|nr:sugar ABC transporter substrate-binding protein [Spirochaetales bacterium]
MKRKLLFGIICLLLTAAMGFAAGQQEGATGDESVTLKVWSWVYSQGEGPVLKAVLQDYRDQNPNVTIEEIDTPWAQAHDKFIVMNQSKDVPQITGVNRNWLTEFVSIGALTDLTPYVESVPGMRDKYYDAVKGEMDGKVWVLPYSGGNAALVYNKKVFAEKGLTPPATLQEFVEVGKILSDPAANKYATQLCIAESNSTGAHVCNYGPVLYSFGGKYLEGKKAAFNSPEGVEALEWMIALEKDLNIAGPGSITVDARAMRESLAGGSSFMNFDGSWGTPFYNKYPEVEIGIAPMPKGASMGTVINIANWGIPAKAKNKDAAWDLLKFIESDENMLRLFEEANVMPCMPKYGELPQFQEKYSGFLITLAESDNFMQTGSVPHESDLYKILVRAYQKAYLGQASAKDALDAAAVEYNKLLDRFYSN